MATKKEIAANKKRKDAQKPLIRGAAECIEYNRVNPGRPPLYHEGFCHIAERMSPATQKQLADMFACSIDAITDWCKAFPNFLAAIKRARKAADDLVEASLHHRAIGYSHPAVKIFNADGEPLIVPYQEHYPPDTAAAFIWLKNRRGADWKDRRDDAGVDPNDAKRMLREEMARIDAATKAEGTPDESKKD